MRTLSNCQARLLALEWQEASFCERDGNKQTNKQNVLSIGLEEKVKKGGTRTATVSALTGMWSMMTPVTHDQFMSFVVLYSADNAYVSFSISHENEQVLYYIHLRV